MTWFFVALVVIALLIVGASLAMCCIRLDRSLVARADVRARERRAEAEIQHVVQHTIQQMFDAARRQR